MTRSARIAALATAAVGLSLTLLLAAPNPTLAAAVSPLSRTWLALGDSYSSGEGTGGTQRPDKGDPDCRRATGRIDADGDPSEAKAWPVVAYEQLQKQDSFIGQDFFACTGNITDDVVHQLAEADPAGKKSWDVVSLSFGGNNIDFSGIIYDCLNLPSTWDADFDFVPGCAIKQKTISRRIDRLVDADVHADGFQGTLTLADVYNRVAQQVKPGGEVVVAGYPQLFADPSDWAWKHRAVPVCDGIWDYDVPLLRQVDDELNAAIRREVAVADGRWASHGIRFVYADLETNVYETATGQHSRCTGNPWLNGLSTGLTAGDLRRERSFHPNRVGHAMSGSYVAALVDHGLARPRRVAQSLPVRQLPLFTTPSGNITCGIVNDHTSTVTGFSPPARGSASAVGCVIGDHDYGTRPEACHSEPTYYDRLGRRGRTVVLECAGDVTLELYGSLTPANVTPAVVGYNTVVDLDAARCTVTSRQVRCVNTDGHGFELSRQANNRF